MTAFVSATAPGQGSSGDITSQISGDELRRRVVEGASVPSKEFRVADVTAAPQVYPQSGTMSVDQEVDRSRREVASGIARASRAVIASTVRVSGMQKWHGRIIEIDEDILTVELVPEDEGPTVLADFALSQLGDEEEVDVGDVVYVTVRSVAGLSGYPTQTSAVRLRRLGKWTNAEVRELEERADQKLSDLERFIE